MAKKLPFELAADEQVLRQESAMFVKSKLMVQSGTMYLTNQRLIFARKKLSQFGLIGLLFGGYAIVFDWRRDQLKGWEKSKYGLNKKVIAITDAEGTAHRFVLTKAYEEWDQALTGKLGG